MTPERQTAAIASVMPAGFLEGLRWNYKGQWIVFDPLSDLNAMHEAEKVLVEHPGLYWFALAKVVGGSLKDIACATASQRAEAFLRTLNLWRSTPCAT
jgi:hypothetical protein